MGATSGALAAAFAELFELPETAVAYDQRVLRDHRKFSTGGRGRSATSVTFTDAANLAITLAGHRRNRDPWAVFNDYARLRAVNDDMELATWDPTLELPSLTALPPGHTFPQAIAALFEAWAKFEFEEVFARSAPKEVLDTFSEQFVRWVEARNAERPYRAPDIWDVEVALCGPWPLASITFMQSEVDDDKRLIAQKQLAKLEYHELVSPRGDDIDEIRQFGRRLAKRYGTGDLDQIKKFSITTITTIGELLR